MILVVQHLGALIRHMAVALGYREGLMVERMDFQIDVGLTRQIAPAAFHGVLRAHPDPQTNLSPSS